MKLFPKYILTLFFLSSIGLQAHSQLVNSKATPETFALKHLLDSLYGKKIISGQCDDSYLQYIQEVTGGKSPAIMGYDFNGICPSQGGNNDAAKAINWVKTMGGIAQFQWHWISPNADGDWSSKNFNLGAALADTAGLAYHNMIRDIDRVSAEIKKMQDAGVPILWRPLHEAEGKWFWWGYSGGDACKKLYRLMYDRMVNHFKLNNLIWVWNSYGTDKENWYPGDDFVDIIAWDYPNYSGTNSSWSQYQKMFGGKGKLFGIGEDGKLTDPEILTSQPWLYFLTWAYMVNDPTQKDGKNPKDWLNQVYNDPRVITLDDLVPGPKAKAGRGQLLFDNDGDGFETATLDGSASTTDKGTITLYTWTENGTQIASGVTASVNLGIGIHSITLTISTSLGESRSGNVVVTVKTPSLSLKKPATASATEANLGNGIENANDGDAATRWSSTYSDPQWYRIDLGKKYTITRVVLSWEVASAKDYTIEVSDDAMNWTTIMVKSNMPSGARIDEISNLNGSGRYIRMFGTKRNTTYGYSIYEFEVYGLAITGIETVNTNSVSVFPTVVGQEKVLNVKLNESITNGSYSIFSMDGKCLTKRNFNARDLKIILNETFHSGVYILKIQGDDISVMKKFIVN
jgi:hypothetical protein